MTSFSSSPRILIVDDEPHICLLIELTLTDLSDMELSVVSVRGGGEALQMLEKENFDLILLDISMPGMDGYELFRHLKQNPATKDISVIFVTGVNEVFNQTVAFGMGAVDFICKPFDPVELVARVENQLKLQRPIDD
jgi:CheY-like chemotaxis protein